jgi:iron complex transport system substrate-binding protein
MLRLLAVLLALALVAAACGDDDADDEAASSDDAAAPEPDGEAATATSVEVLDTAGRYVDVERPVERVVVLWSNPAEMMRAMGAVDRIVGIDQSTQDLVDQGLYPELEDAENVGTFDEPNLEAIAALEPDVVIQLATYSPFPAETQEALADFDIPVVGLDFFKVDIFFQELRTLGGLLDLQDEAEELVGFFEGYTDEVAERLDGLADEERKSVYFEAEADYTTYGGAGDGAGIPGLIRAAGGIDLYPELTQVTFEVDPEDVPARNPDVIVKGQPDGYLLEDSSAFETVRQGILDRPELAGTTAVQNDDVYVMSFDVAGGARKVFGPAFLAKVLYPDRFADFDPYEFLRTYLEEYQELDYQGVYLHPDYAETG